VNEDLSQMISKIMSSPGFGNLVNELKQSGAEGASESAEKPAPSPEEMAKKIPELLHSMGADGKTPENADAAKINKAVNALSKMDNKNCEKLLCALKPYLNKERGEVIDKAMNVMKLTDILNLLGEGDGK